MAKGAVFTMMLEVGLRANDRLAVEADQEAFCGLFMEGLGSPVWGSKNTIQKITRVRGIVQNGLDMASTALMLFDIKGNSYPSLKKLY